MQYRLLIILVIIFLFSGCTHIDDNLSRAEGTEFEGYVSPALTLGLSAAANFDNGTVSTSIQTFIPPSDITLDRFYLVGDWLFAEDYIEAKSIGARLLIPYGGAKVKMIASAQEPTMFQVVQDGAPLSFGTAEEKKAYALIDDDRGVGLHTVEVFIEKPGFRIYTVEFGE